VRILYLHQYFLTPDMSGGTRSYELARRFVAAGHEVHMITSDQRPGPGTAAWRDSNEAGIHVHWARVPYGNEMGFGRRLIAFLSFAIRATTLTSRLAGDVILATSTPLTIAIPALLVSAWKRIPFVFEVRDMWPDVPIAIGALRNPILVWMARWLEMTAYRRAVHIVALAPGMRDDMVARGIPAEKVSVVPNGCDLDIFAPDPARAQPRDRFPWLGRRKLVLFTGAFGIVNGVEYFVHLAEEVARIDPEIRFVAIGSGKEWERVRARAATTGVLDRTFYLFGAIPKREVAGWLQAADLVVALFTGPPTVWKNAVPNKFFDALAAGKPIASNFDGWLARIAVESQVGLTLDVDPTAAARQVVDMLGDDLWLSGVPARARVLAEGRFNREGLARQMLDVLTAAAGRRSHGAA